jgi:hypothetical protein
MDIKELLARRSDLSTFLIHLTREYPEGTPAKDNLKSILNDKLIEARNPYGSAMLRLKALRADNTENVTTQRVVCFTETPLEHVRLLVEPIQGKQYKFGPYGIAITKRTARVCDVNPVWYLDITPKHDWLTKPLNRLIDAEIQTGKFPTSDIAKLSPFIEQMGSSPQYFKEYWWEREWRCRGDFDLSTAKFIIICPEKYLDEITPQWAHDMNIRAIDPEWSLEQIIGRLAGFSPDDIDPFQVRPHKHNILGSILKKMIQQLSE